MCIQHQSTAILRSEHTSRSINTCVGLDEAISVAFQLARITNAAIVLLSGRTPTRLLSLLTLLFSWLTLLLWLPLLTLGPLTIWCTRLAVHTCALIEWKLSV